MSLSKQVSYLAVASAATAGTIAGVYYGYLAIRNITAILRKPSHPNPDDASWTEVGTLAELMAYPIKSCGVVHLEAAQCTSLGLKEGWLRDRFLMVIDSTNNFITARNYPELLMINPLVRNSILTLDYKGSGTLHVNLAEVTAVGKPETAVVWGVEVPVFDCGREAEKWFSQLLNKPGESFRLVYYASQDCRELRDAAHRFYKISRKDTGALPDETPYNMINQASVDDLNQKLQEEQCQVSYRNFRPNFLLKGAQPFAEDNWKYIKIDGNIFEIVKPCTRCVLTTIDPETGIRHEKSEPLTTLRRYRQASEPAERRETGTSPKMGVQMALRSAAGNHIRLNSPVYAYLKN